MSLFKGLFMEKIDSCEALFLDLWDFLVWFENFTFYTSLAWIAVGLVAGIVVTVFYFHSFHGVMRD